jgi:hypothetical protein
MSRIKEYPSITSFDGTTDALAIEQTDGANNRTRKVSPAQIKQYVLGNAIDDIYSVMGQNGAKNLIPYPYYEKTHTENGITWTDNGDGTVTANGTATAASYFTLSNRTLGTNMADSLVEGERYILTGCPTGGSNQKYDIFINETYNGAEVGMAFDYGNGATFTLNHKTENNYGLGLRIRSGQTVSNLTFKPMLRLASDSDNTYQPYAKTNRQLTEVIGDLSQTSVTGATVAAQLGVLGNILSFTHFVQIPFTTSVLDSIKAAFENNTIPVDIYGITLGMVRGGAGSQRVIFIAQNQSISTSQTRFAAVYFGAYTAPRFCQKQDGTAWTDVAL